MSNSMFKKMPPNQELIKRGLSTVEAAHYLGVSVSYLNQARSNSPAARKLDAPRHVKVGKKIIYLIDVLDAWLEFDRSNNDE